MSPPAGRRRRSPDPLDREALRSLEDALKRSVAGEVRFDDGSRALYATDGSNYRMPPLGVVIPRDADDVAATLAACRAHRAPILGRGGGTSLAGQCCNTAVVLDFTKYMNRVLAIDPEARTARVQPGVVLDDLRTQAERHHLTFAPDPATHTHNTLGGMIGNNSCGVHSLMGGRTSDNVEALDLLLYDGTRLRVGAAGDDELRGDGRIGEIHRALRDLRDRYADDIRARFPPIPRRVSGYNLEDLLPERGFHVARSLVGSEGTCALLTEATVRLVESPPVRVLVALGFEDIYVAADRVPQILEFGPIGLEGMDEGLIDDMKALGLHPGNIKLLPDGHGWLLVEFGAATVEAADACARRMMEALKSGPGAPAMKLFDRKDEEKKIWQVRESSLGATAHVPNKAVTWEGWEDSAVPVDKLGEYLRRFRDLLDRYGYRTDLYGHFGQGCLHCRIDFDLETRPGIDHYLGFISEAADLVVALGGSFSGEHGDGQSRAQLLPRMFGERLMGAFREFKRIWDPDGLMNPGKVIDAYRIDENLRLGTDYEPAQPTTLFAYPADAGSFPRAMLRCVGVGECRRRVGGTMCPSYRATMEEMHSTRGRARLLWEMLEGEVIRHGWAAEPVREALHLCLSCKGCKGDCPVKVDMATYKAEFHAHHYQGRLRPLPMYAFGLIDVWARLAAHTPGLANRGAESAFARRLLGLARDRRLPRFAPRTFRAGFRPRSAKAGAPRVILWPDTFNNHFRPSVLHAAVALLEDAGYAVTLPPKPLCCGRALFDPGFVERAKRYLAEILATLRRDIRDGVPLVGLEPACVSVFKDELINLFPSDEDAKRLSLQTRLLSEVLDGTGWSPPQVGGRALVHRHCHHKALLDTCADARLLAAAGIEADFPDTGCCGMAGSFGFEADKAEVSLAIAEQDVLPKVRGAAAEAVIVADGFSCREQIEQLSGRATLHTAELLARGLKGD